MHRLLLVIFVLLAPPLAAQDTEAGPADEAETVEADAGDDAAPVEEVTDEEVEELLDLDEDWDEDAEEDVFIPSENVKYEQSIPFPTDI